MPQRSHIVGGTALITATTTIMDGTTAGTTIGIGTTGSGRITANTRRPDFGSPSGEPRLRLTPPDILTSSPIPNGTKQLQSTSLGCSPKLVQRIGRNRRSGDLRIGEVRFEADRLPGPGAG
jgi:hypothetical protein